MCIQSDSLRFDRNNFHVNSVDMPKKIILLLFCICAGVLSYVTLDYWATNNGIPEKKFEQMWHEDVALLEESKKLPSPWYSIKQIEIYPGDSKAKAWMKNVKVPLESTSNGKFKMEILVLTWEEDGKAGAVVQYDLVDLKTQNLVWELGRTFILEDHKRTLPD